MALIASLIEAIAGPNPLARLIQGGLGRGGRGGGGGGYGGRGRGGSGYGGRPNLSDEESMRRSAERYARSEGLKENWPAFNYQGVLDGQKKDPLGLGQLLLDDSPGYQDPQKFLDSLNSAMPLNLGKPR